MSIFGGVAFFLVKNIISCKNVSFWAYEWISKNSDKIMSCKLWGKITSVSVNINFGAKMLILCKKKNEILREMLTFSLSMHYHWKWLSFCKMCLFLEKKWLLVCRFIYINKVSNSDKKNFNFFGYVNLYMC